MEQVLARLRYCRSARPTAVVLVHQSGLTVGDADGTPLVFRSEKDAVDFAQDFLCEPHQVQRHIPG